MQVLLGLQGKAKIIVISIILFTVGLIIGLVGLITGSYLLGVFALLGLIWYLLIQIGGIVMYPGSFFFTRSDIQIRFSRETGSRIIDCFNAIQTLATFIIRRKYEPYRNHIDFVAAIDRYMAFTISMLQMFENTLSERKAIMLRNFRQLKSILQQREGENLSLLELIHRPNLINNLQQHQLHFYKTKFTSIGQNIKIIAEILKTYTPPLGTLQLMKFRMQAQNLYEIRFGFASWARLFDYQINMIPTTDGHKIQSTIIHRIKYRTSQQQETETKNKKTVLFCNPNGVFIQFFGADNSYIRNYLRLGYNVILWNYRGYGQSTGNPTIRLSQIDAMKVYGFYRSLGYDIQIVHGYSIGGAAAVGLDEQTEKIDSGVKILIVDRSFSSIGQMSVEFGNTLHRLAKIIFYRENIDLSKQFQAVRCRKLLIWDYSDEVIPDKASVKNKILKRRRSSLVQSNYTFDQESERDQLNQDVTALRPQVSSGAAFEQITRKLESVVIDILSKSRNSHSDKELNVFDDREISAGSTNGGMDADNLDSLIRSINKLDGGGINIFQNPHQLQHIFHEKPDYFYHIMQSYILGLVCYGSYLPLRPIIHDHQQIKADTLRKIQRLLKQISSQRQVNTQNLPGQRNNIHSNVYEIYQRISSLIEEFYCQQWFAIHGSLLPTNNGHNSSLTEEQYRVLNSYINFGKQQMSQSHQQEENY